MPRDRLGPLAEREFRLLFLGRVTSMLGNAIAPVALAFAVLDLTGSTSDLGFVLAARSVPQVLFLLFGGVWADRLPRHHVMVASSVVSAVAQGAVALVLLTHAAEVWHLLALGALNGASSAFFFPASTGVIPQTVRPGLLQQANALLRLAVNGTWIAGAGLGGLLVAATSPGWAILIDAFTFALGGLFIGLMRLPASLRLEASTVLADLRDGWTEFRARTWLWVIVAQFSLVNAAQTGALNVLGPVIAKRDLGGPGAWGLILALQSTGLVAAGFLMLRFRPQRMLVVATLGVLLLALPTAALAGPAPLAVIVVAAFAAGFGVEVFGVLWDTTMQQEVPQDKLSRVYSYDALGSFVLIPLGLAAAGPVADAIGIRTTLLGATALLVTATLPVLAVPDVRRVTRKRLTPAQPLPSL